MLNLHVLLVDDESDIRAALAAALQRDPFFIVRPCACGADALRTAATWRPDLILLDAVMTDMDAPTVLARLRADQRTAPIPVVFMTKHLHARTSKRLKSLGAAGAITKTSNATALAAELRRFVAAEGVLAPAREGFFRRLQADARALAACRPRLAQTHPESALTRIKEIAHSLAGAGGIFGFAGISCESAALSDAAVSHLAGRAKPRDVERALDRLLERIALH